MIQWIKFDDYTPNVMSIWWIEVKLLFKYCISIRIRVDLGSTGFNSKVRYPDDELLDSLIEFSFKSRQARCWCLLQWFGNEKNLDLERIMNGSTGKLLNWWTNWEWTEIDGRWLRTEREGLGSWLITKVDNEQMKQFDCWFWKLIC